MLSTNQQDEHTPLLKSSTKVEAKTIEAKIKITKISPPATPKKLSIKEKIINALYLFLGSAVTIGAGLGIQTYWMLTSAIGAGGAGMGLAVSGGTALAAIIGVSIASVIITVPIMAFLYWSYLKTEERLLHDIHLQKEKEKKLQTENEALESKWEEEKFAYFLSLLRLHVALKQQGKELSEDVIRCKEGENMSINATALVTLVKQVYKELIISSKNNVGSAPLNDTYFISLTEPNNTLKEQVKNIVSNSSCVDKNNETITLDNCIIRRPPTLSPVKSKTASYAEATAWGLFAGTALYSGILGTTWGTTAVVMGGVTVAALATPVVGWALLGVSAVVCIGLGALYAYSRYKNGQRRAALENMEIANAALEKQNDSIGKNKKDLIAEKKYVNEKRKEIVVEMKQEEEKKRETEKNKIAEERKKLEEDKKNIEEARRQLEEDRKKIETEKQQLRAVIEIVKNKNGEKEGEKEGEKIKREKTAGIETVNESKNEPHDEPLSKKPKIEYISTHSELFSHPNQSQEIEKPLNLNSQIKNNNL